MSGPVVVGLDPSPLRLGWGAVLLDEGAAVACGMERLDLPGKGWSDDQAREALRVVDERLSRIGHTVAAVYIEQPALPPASGPKSAFNAGRAVQEVLVAARRRWPHADGPHFLQPSEWRKLAGLNGRATKADIRFAAEWLMSEVFGPKRQDAADALCVALAGQRRNAETWSRAVERGAA